LECGIGARGQKAHMWLPGGRKGFKIGSLFRHNAGSDGRTDGHVDVANTALCIASRE